MSSLHFEHGRSPARISEPRRAGLAEWRGGQMDRRRAWPQQRGDLELGKLMALVKSHILAMSARPDGVLSAAQPARSLDLLCPDEWRDRCFPQAGHSSARRAKASLELAGRLPSRAAPSLTRWKVHQRDHKRRECNSDLAAGQRAAPKPLLELAGHGGRRRRRRRAATSTLRSLARLSSFCELAPSQQHNWCDTQNGRARRRPASELANCLRGASE